MYRLVVWPLTLLRGVACGQLHIALHATLVSWPLNRLMVAGVTNAAVTGVSKVHQGLGKLFYWVGQVRPWPLGLLSVDAAAVFALGLRAHGIGMALHRLLRIEAM